MDRADLLRSLADTIRPLSAARGLAADCYRAPEVFALEASELFPRSWLALARSAELAQPGDFVTAEIAGEPVLLVRDRLGGVNGFYNVCRHRGSRLLDAPSGHLRHAIVCPYHAWSYELDGRVKHAGGLDCDPTLALGRLPLAERAGFVFVGLAPAESPGAAFADLPDLARFGLERLQRVRALEYTVEANWKLVCENYSECYHCPRGHPQLDRLCDVSAGGFEAGRSFNGGPMRLRAGVETLSMSGRRAWQRLDPAATHGELVHYYLVYPNLMLGIHPDYLTVHSVWPLAPQRSRVRCEICALPEGLTDAAGADVVEFWELTNEQDWALVERAQLGVRSRGYRPGPYHASERCVHAFDRWYAEWLSGALRR